MNFPGNLYKRIIKSGTILVCPICKKAQARVVLDFCPDETWHWSALKPLTDSAPGVSDCHLERYVTFSGFFSTDEGFI